MTSAGHEAISLYIFIPAAAMINFAVITITITIFCKKMQSPTSPSVIFSTHLHLLSLSPLALAPLSSDQYLQP